MTKMPKRVEYIPAVYERGMIPVGIYCRVSSNSTEQLRSLSAQASELTNYVASHGNWTQIDTYIEVASAKEEGGREQFARMLKDCRDGRIRIVIVKNISRFGRDTVDVLDSIRQMKEAGTRIVFKEENLDTNNLDDTMLISIIEAVSQAENESRSENIRIGMRFRAANGTLGFYKRKCYGYYNDAEGNLAIDEAQAETVRLIYSLYLEGKSVLGIIENPGSTRYSKMRSISGKSTY